MNMLFTDRELALSPQVPRYASGPADLGYYYPALDFTFTQVGLDQTGITVLPGTAVGVRTDYDSRHGCWTLPGLVLLEGSRFVSKGTPTQRNTIVDVALVQEGPFPWGDQGSVIAFMVDHGHFTTNPPVPYLECRFSDIYMASTDYHIAAGLLETAIDNNGMVSYSSSMTWALRDCSLWGGIINLGQPPYGDCQTFVFAPGSVSWANNFFERVRIGLDPTWYRDNGTVNVDLPVLAYNNTFRGGRLRVEPCPTSTGNWIFRDNLFDKVAFEQFGYGGAVPLDHDHNGYWQRLPSELWWFQTDRLPITNPGTDGAGDVLLAAAPQYETSAFGDHYLPVSSPLHGAGSRTPAAAGLYHYTTRAAQVKDANQAAVDIGLHYVAADSAGLPLDYDHDGIPDHVENWHGDGDYNSHTDSETDWHSAYTTTGVYDPTNAVYDDVDLSGNGLVGRIKRALGLNALDAGDSLRLNQVTTGEEPDFATFEVSVSYDAVTNAGTLSLQMNGAPVTLEERTRASNGNCLLSFNVAFDPMGLHFLASEFRLNSDPGADHPVTLGSGGLLPFYSSNSVQLFEAGSMFDDSGAYLDAKLFAQGASYTIELWDPSTTPPTHIKTITNSTFNGMIQEDWDLTLADGVTLYTNREVRAEFNVAYANNPGNVSTNPPKKHLVKAEGSLSEGGVNMDVVYFRTPTNDAWASEFAKNGAIWNAMQGVVDALINPVWPYPVYYSYFNRYLPDTHGAYPGYLTKRARATNDSATLPTVLDTLLPDLTNGVTKQIYIHGHGTNGWISSHDNSAYLTAFDVSRALKNTYSKTHLTVHNPYRFVFLDGCATASGPDWRRAFGIYPIDTDSQGQAKRNKTGPQAYVGWAEVVFSGLNKRNHTTDDVIIVRAYAQMLQRFYTFWMNRFTLKECLDDAAIRRPNAFPLPVPQNDSCVLLLEGNPYTFNHVLTSKIYIIGYPGLRVDGVDTSLNSDKTYAAPKNIE